MKGIIASFAYAYSSRDNTTYGTLAFSNDIEFAQYIGRASRSVAVLSVTYTDSHGIEAFREARLERDRMESER